MKGIILAGGKGTRLFPLTKVLSKQILNIYDKPMIYYSLSILLLLEIDDILIISSKEHIEFYEKLFGDGSDLNINFEYCIQDNPNGLAEALILGKDFVGEDSFTLILGDNFLLGNELKNILLDAKKSVINSDNASIFTSPVTNPKEFGIAEIDDRGNLISIEEKPSNPKSNKAVIGLYIYPNYAINLAENVKPSIRGELEITSVNEMLLSEGKLEVTEMGRGIIWLDTGNYDNLHEASSLVRQIVKRQGLNVGCIEEILFDSKKISQSEMLNIIRSYPDCEYRKYLEMILDN